MSNVAQDVATAISIRDQAWAKAREDRAEIEAVMMKVFHDKQLTPRDVVVIHQCMAMVVGELAMREEGLVT